MAPLSEMNDRIYVIYGDQPKEMVHTALDHLNLADHIDKNMVIGMKPNLVVEEMAGEKIGIIENPEE